MPAGNEQYLGVNGAWGGGIEDGDFGSDCSWLLPVSSCRLQSYLK
jgi:hypothetical protein